MVALPENDGAHAATEPVIWPAWLRAEDDCSPAMAVVALGSNLEDRDEWLSRARARLKLLPLTRPGLASPIIETAPLEYLAQGPFRNQLVILYTRLAPEALLDALQAIEDGLGRKREILKGPRNIDLDILFYGRRRYRSSRLIIPHTAWGIRPFLGTLAAAYSDYRPWD